MNGYQKAIKRGIENALDKYDKKCQEIAKNEPKVWIGIEEAKALLRRIPEFKENGDWQLPIERLKERIAKVDGK